MIYVAYNNDLSIEGFFVESQKEKGVIPTPYVGIPDSLYEEVFKLNCTGNIFLKNKPVTETINDITFFEIKQIAFQEIIDEMPSQIEIDFAQYVLSTEDRLTILESKINGGV